MTNYRIEKSKLIFNQANGFLKIIDGIPYKHEDIMYLNPFYINCLFCCELYFKALLIYNGYPVKVLRKKGHKLLDLFNMLGEDDKRIIRNIFEIEIQEDMIDYLDRINNDFVNMRYVYVNGNKIDSKTINNNFAKTIRLMYRLQNFVSLKLYNRDTYEDVINNVSI